jgi:hypothetical protein
MSDSFPMTQAEMWRAIEDLDPAAQLRAEPPAGWTARLPAIVYDPQARRPVTSPRAHSEAQAIERLWARLLSLSEASTLWMRPREPATRTFAGTELNGLRCDLNPAGVVLPGRCRRPARGRPVPPLRQCSLAPACTSPAAGLPRLARARHPLPALPCPGLQTGRPDPRLAAAGFGRPWAERHPSVSLVRLGGGYD